MSDLPVQLWSCGGGRQSAGIAALIVEGRLPRPDHVAMVRIEWEHARVWPYVDTFIRPALADLGIPFSAIDRAEYASRDFFGGASGMIPLVPVYTDQSGSPAKLSEFCSGEWKREVVMRWAAEQLGWKERGVDNWIGITWDERHRRRGPRRHWFRPVYPLLDTLPTHVSGCYSAVERMGWPEPPRSRCFHCPNQSDTEWAELSPTEWEAACARDEWIRETDPHAYLHRSCLPLRLVTLKPHADVPGLFTGGCSSGTCY
jgi:hypothetical protein